jgi:hypothetical protein
MNTGRLSKLLRMVALLLPVLLAGAKPTRGQDCYPAEVKETVQNVLRLPPAARFQFRVSELPKLEEELMGIEEATLGTNTVRPIKFYSVTPATYEVVNGRITSVTVELDRDSVWLVAMGPDKSTYQLAGFPDPASGFNKLMSDIGIKVSETDAAMDVFELFVRLTRGPQSISEVIADTMQLRSVALQDFRLRLPELKRLAAFEEWWTEMPTTLKRKIVAPKLQLRENRFQVTYYRYVAGRISLETVLVNRDATVSPSTSKPLYVK